MRSARRIREMGLGARPVVRMARSIAIAFIIALSPSIARAHPLHTSFAQLAVDTETGAVNVSLRVFIDDFSAAAAQWSKRNPGESGMSAAVAYARASFTIRESSGRAIILQSCGEKRVGDLMYVCLRGKLSPRASVSTVLSRPLVEKFDDQVNIVQVTYSNRKANLLFTRGDKEKRLP